MFTAAFLTRSLYTVFALAFCTELGAEKVKKNFSI